MASALQGVKVLELTRFIAGPYAGSVLASLGADVIKIEPPTGDVVRTMGPKINGVGVPFEMLNHNKKGLVVDLKHPQGREVIHEMARHADIVLESSRPGTSERLGVGYEQLRPFNARLIYCSISGFGQESPRGGVDIVAQAMGGLMGITGVAGGPPIKVSQPIADFGSGMWAVIGILAALQARERTGCGQLVDSALLDTPIAWSLWESSRYFAKGEIPQPLGSSHRNVAPYRAFQCSDGRHVAVGGASQDIWERLCAAIERPELLRDSRYASTISRVDNRDSLESTLEEVFVKRPHGEWLALLEKNRVPCGLVKRFDEALEDPLVKARKMIAEVEHSEAGSMRLVDVPVYLSDTPRLPVQQAPKLGEHSTSTLKEWGFAQPRIAELIQNGIVMQG